MNVLDRYNRQGNYVSRGGETIFTYITHDIDILFRNFMRIYECIMQIIEYIMGISPILNVQAPNFILIIF